MGVDFFLETVNVFPGTISIISHFFFCVNNPRESTSVAFCSQRYLEIAFWYYFVLNCSIAATYKGSFALHMIQFLKLVGYLGNKTSL